jgi:hypothetical protein
MARALVIAALLAAAGVVHAQALDDARLGASAAELHAVIDHAAQAGLPSEVLVAKAREGLAKGVPPARVVAVVRGLANALATARSEAASFAGASPPPGLLKAIVEAHMAHAGAADVATVLRAGGRERAVAVLTDLAQRGYPPPAAAQAVASLNGQKNALQQLVGQAERLRTVDGATPADALDALVRAGMQNGNLDHAEGLLHRNDAADDSHAPNRETSGVRGPASGGIAAPGRGKGRP